MDESAPRVIVLGADDHVAGVRDAVRSGGGRLVGSAMANTGGAVDGDTVDGASDCDGDTADCDDNASDCGGDTADCDPTDPAVDAAAATADAVVAVGEDAIRSAVVADHGAPVLPVEAGRYSVPRSSVSTAIERLLAGDVDRVTHPILGVAIDGTPVHRGAFDVALIANQPSRISEYAVGFDRGHEETFRADGIVVATPLGSGEYAASVGGSVLDPGSGLSVVPVAPFTTQVDAWVVSRGVTLSVQRDVNPVRLVVDGSPRELVPPKRPVRVETVDRVEILSVRA